MLCSKKDGLNLYEEKTSKKKHNNYEIVTKLKLE